MLVFTIANVKKKHLKKNFTRRDKSPLSQQMACKQCKHAKIELFKPPLQSLWGSKASGEGKYTRGGREERIAVGEGSLRTTVSAKQADVRPNF